MKDNKAVGGYPPDEQARKLDEFYAALGRNLIKTDAISIEFYLSCIKAFDNDPVKAAKVYTNVHMKAEQASNTYRKQRIKTIKANPFPKSKNEVEQEIEDIVQKGMAIFKKILEEELFDILGASAEKRFLQSTIH